MKPFFTEGDFLTPTHRDECARIANAKVAPLLEALKAIAETHTGDSTGIVEHRNTWTDWAKKKARSALEDSNAKG